jgi:hypothetical protein
MSRDKEYDDYCKKAGIENRNRTETTFNPTAPSDYENMAARRTKALGESMKQTISEHEYEKNRAAYIEYLLMCVRLGDWHGVSDAANDLRVLEAKEGK